MEYASDKPEVILVHGLWFGSWAMSRLARKLQARGFRVRRFSYSSTRGDLGSHARELREFAQMSGASRLHFVSHSLGGLVTLQMLNETQNLAPGRVVLLGSPLGGSITARRSARVPGAGKLLGEIRSTLESGYARVPQDRETGMIAGSKGIGLGLLVGGTGAPGDGTVAVRETLTDGLKDHLVLPANHTGLLFSDEVVRQAAHFLKTGIFEQAAA